MSSTGIVFNGSSPSANNFMFVHPMLGGNEIIRETNRMEICFDILKADRVFYKTATQP